MEKKALSWVSSLLLLTIVILSGCQSDEATSETESGEGAEEGALEITYFNSLNTAVAANLTTLNDVAAYQELEKRTGVKVDFEHPPVGGDVNQQFNLMMASGDLPDVIEWLWTGVPGGITKYANEKKLVRLNDYLDEHAPNLSAVLEENPEWRKQISADDGGIYQFPFLRGDEKLLTFFGPIIRQDWLDDLGLERPETIDEWHEVLTAFKNEDPNGNGEADEIPLLPDLASNAFVGAFGVIPGFYHEDNEVHYGPIEPEFKEFLTLMNQWYEEGLIDPDFVATDSKLRDAKVTGNQLGSFISYGGSGIGHYMTLMKGDPNFHLAPVRYPSLEKGEVPDFAHKDHAYNGIGAAITTSNQQIEETIEWLDYNYGEEGHMLFNFGVEGESYTMEDDYPTYTKTITDNPDGLPMVQALGQYVRAGYNGPFVQDVRYIEQYMQMPEQQEAIVIWGEGKHDKVMPHISPTEEESGELSSILNDVNTYRETMVNKFIMGEEPLDGFDDYVETLKGMGIERAIEINQAALNRFNER
ncbi:extracellular solute-binding protein [Bacillaceae bacterium SIJ1]|uniref:extracellular solute-binding protein n=1 Tax=Litoribacterium kuwaitense TaxID=1398745 RepID=UPI0013EC196B|nr:extracellular solute-binding protein [Litoribacterium kuwaitense]NGP46293.1 extracellular solute-binding protein [Litoribacterium kuwaitense]